MSKSEPITYDLTVVGAGMAGMAATLYAANQGLTVTQVGSSMEIGFASGLFDLLGCHPMEKKQRRENPWEGIDALVKDLPRHPYAHVVKTDIEAAFEALFTFLGGEGLKYKRYPEQNVNIITPMGTLKTTYGVPESMWPGVEALEKKCKCILVGIKGLKGFSVKLIADQMQSVWPRLSPVEIAFPGTVHRYEVYPEHLANALVVSRNRQLLADVLKPHVKDAKALAMPAMLGLYNTQRVIAELTESLGVPIFEIPTMPPGISGMRLKAVFEKGLRNKGIRYESQKKVLRIDPIPNKGFEIHIGKNHIEATVRSRGLILATGRFLGGGLSADRKQIRETLLDLPVYQPNKRAKWHQEDLFDPKGHAINLAGLETDSDFRPLDKDGNPAFETLYAAGSILAHQDWKRMKCGVGLAVATAYKAVTCFVEQLGRRHE